MDETRTSVTAFATALQGVKKFSEKQREKWSAYAGALPDEFVVFLTRIATENPDNMLLLDKNLEQKKIALSGDDVGAWSRILKGERSLLEQIA